MLVLLGFTCPDQKETATLPTHLRFPGLIRSRPSVVSISGSCGFCLHSQLWVSSLLRETFFFFLCPLPRLQLNKPVFTVCVCANMTMSSLSPLIFLRASSSAKGALCSSIIQLSVSTSKEDETEAAELEQRSSLAASLPLVSPIQRPQPEFVPVPCVCEWREGENEWGR